MKSLEEPRYIKTAMIFITVSSLSIIVLLPIFYILSQAFSAGFTAYVDAITDSETLFSLQLSLLVTFFSVCINLIFGLSIAWSIGKFKVPGSKIITSLIELPLSVSPVIAGFTFILLLGKYSLLGSWFDRKGIDIIYAVPGVVIATLFVTLPYIAREIIPLMQETGKDEEEAAMLLGASGLRTFFYITLPKIKWGVIYGLLITNARAMGEFGAVAVVSGHLRNKTTTLTLHIEMLYNEYNFSKSFAAASLLTFLALLTLLLKSWIEWRKIEK